MQDFVDLRGASGATYRFRLWPTDAPHKPMAGNYVCVQATGRDYAILTVGECLDLSLARDELPKRIREATTHIYTRLNIARATRASEHEDLAAQHATGKARVSAG